MLVRVCGRFPVRKLAQTGAALGPKKKKKGGAGKVIEVKIPDPEKVQKSKIIKHF